VALRQQNRRVRGGHGGGTLTRRYHGLLVAALKPPLGRTLLVAKVDEQIEYAELTRPLFVNRWSDGVVDPSGYLDLEPFHLDGRTPVWAYACADVFLEKRIFMEPGANTTYVQYRLLRAEGPATLEIKDWSPTATTTQPRKVAQNSEARAPDDEPLARLGHMRGSLSTVRQRPCMPG
jgi:predicted glycogen debranching enzyme